MEDNQVGAFCVNFLNFAWSSLLNDYLKRKKKQAYAFVYNLLLTSIEQTVDFVCGDKTFNLMKV